MELTTPIMFLIDFINKEMVKPDLSPETLKVLNQLHFTVTRLVTVEKKMLTTTFNHGHAIGVNETSAIPVYKETYSLEELLNILYKEKQPPTEDNQEMLVNALLQLSLTGKS